jgi:phosphate acetyltransferase
MTNSLYISTTEAGSGKALVSLGIIDFLLRRTTKVHFFRPLIQPSEKLSQAYPENQSRDEDIDLLVTHFNLRQTYEESYGLLLREANDLIVPAPHRRGDRHHHQQIQGVGIAGRLLAVRRV